MERLGEGKRAAQRRRLNHGRGIEEMGVVRWSYAVNSTELSSSDWRAQQSQASDFSHYHLQAARSEMRSARNSSRRPTASRVDRRLRGHSVLTLRSSRPTFRQSSSPIVSDREAGNETRIQNG